MPDPTPEPGAATPAAPLSRRAIREAERAASSAAGAVPSPLPSTPPIAPVMQPAEPAHDPEPKDLLTASPAPSKAGRNLPAAIAVGLALGAVLIAALFIRKEAFVVVAIAACGVGLWELERALRTRDIRIPLLPLLVGMVGTLVSAYTAGVEALLVAFLLTAGGVFVWRVLDGGGAPALRDATAGIFAAAYIPFLAGFIMIMLSADDGAWRVLMFLAIVVSNDVGGYAAGVLFGKHPMAPTVSPKKSWEGFAGSMLVAALVGIAFAVLALDAPWYAGLGIGVLGVMAATLGDLAESLIKRDLGVKDMGNLLPGHGGILDRLDSILIAAPVIFAVLLVAAPK